MSYLSALEKNFLMRKLGVTDQTIPINQLRRMWYAQVLGSALNTAQTPFNDLEWRWLMKTVADGGGDVTEEDYDDLWRQMVKIIGLTPVKSYLENQKIYYRNAP